MISPSKEVIESPLTLKKSLITELFNSLGITGIVNYTFPLKSGVPTGNQLFPKM